MLTVMFTLQTAWAGHSETAKGMHLTAGWVKNYSLLKSLKTCCVTWVAVSAKLLNLDRIFFLSAKMYWYIAYKYNVKSMTVNAESLT